MKTDKNGISLIVLVITIIVMIILAATIILSLDGSNIIERAKGAQSENDIAVAKEIVALAKSEWAFERQEGYDTFREYAESKLEEAGFDMDDTYVEDSGRVLFGIAAKFVKAGVEIGTEVQGYSLNTATTYTTSGKENTTDENMEEVNIPHPATLIRNEGIEWQYFGLDENGEALIVESIESLNDSPIIRLKGKGGFINGPQELNDVCEAMYSSNMGTARSINRDDVERVLEYTGEKCSYIDANGNEQLLSKPKTIDEIAKEIGYDISNFSGLTPEEDKTVEEYLVTHYVLGSYLFDDYYENKYNIERNNLIFDGPIYWLATPSVEVLFNYNKVNFQVCRVDGFYVGDWDMYPEPEDDDAYIRPVVKLNPNVQMIYENGVVTLK